MITNIIKSLSTTLIISGAISLCLYFIGLNPIKTFTISLISIFILGFLVGQISETLAIINNKKLENERIKEFTKQGVSVECAYCGEPNFVPIRFDIKNQFNCNKCNQTNSIYIDIITTQITSPLQSPQMQVQTINPDEKDAIDKL